MMLTEAYRPTNFAKFVGNQDIVREIMAMVKKGDFPHLLFSGIAGVGKTTMAYIIVKRTFGKIWRSKCLELNASDDNSINTIRSTVKQYAATSGSANSITGRSGPNFRVIILDEADHLTTQAQAALRRIMEKYSKYCKFILICNYKHKIIPAIQSRCSVFDFTPIPAKSIYLKLQEICAQEGIDVEDSVLKKIAEESNGDLRSAINNYLERFRNARKRVTDDDFNKTKKRLSPSLAASIIRNALNGHFRKARWRLLTAIERGINLRQVLLEITNQVVEMKLKNGQSYPDWIQAAICKAALDCDYYITQGCYPHIVIAGIVAKIAEIGQIAKERLQK